jgi:hypothetical protein
MEIVLKTREEQRASLVHQLELHATSELQWDQPPQYQQKQS